MRPALVAALIIVAWSVPAPACVSPAEETPYRIEHERFGDIGREVVTVRCEAEQLVVDRTVEVTVRVLFATIYRREAHYREIWQDGRLVRFESHTDDNGRRIAVVARRRDGGVIIEGPYGPREAPSDVVPTDPWSQNVVDRTLLFDRTDGRVLQVNVADAGQEPVQVDGRTICARKYVVSGDLERELWYDPTGVWLKSRFRREGGAITITRQLPS